jgi:hypothetical protein
MSFIEHRVCRTNDANGLHPKTGPLVGAEQLLTHLVAAFNSLVCANAEFMNVQFR